MKSILALGAGLLICLSSMACSPVTREKVLSIKLNQTTKADVEKMFGRPQAVDQFEGPGGPATTYVYRDAIANRAGALVWMQYHHLAVEMVGNRVTGFLFVCNRGQDATRVDAKKLARVTLGRMNRAEVLALLGPPSGRAMLRTGLPHMKHAAIADGDGELLAWAEAPPVEGNWQVKEMQMKIYILLFDKDDRVWDVARRSIRIPL